MSDILRVKHNKEHPYLMVSKELIRNNEISMDTQMFIIYCLSFPDNWKISIPSLIKLKKISKNKMYRMINEAIKEGYIKRETYLDSGKKRYKYSVSESPIFKKCLLCPQKQDTENEDSNRIMKLKKKQQPLTPSKKVVCSSDLKELKKKWIKEKRDPKTMEEVFKIFEETLPGKICHKIGWLEGTYKNILKKQIAKKETEEIISVRREFCLNDRPRWITEKDHVSVGRNQYRFDKNEEFWKKHNLGIKDLIEKSKNDKSVRRIRV